MLHSAPPWGATVRCLGYFLIPITRKLQTLPFYPRISHPVFLSRSQNRGVHTGQNDTKRDRLSFDVVIVGGGPAGLSAAIRLKQIAERENRDISVCLVDKSADIGGHILSGNVFQPTSLDLLVPGWRALTGVPPKGAPKGPPVGASRADAAASPAVASAGVQGEAPQRVLHWGPPEGPPEGLGQPPPMTPVAEDRFEILLSRKYSVSVPSLFLPRTLQNDGNFVVSLGALCRWLGDYAESLGVEVLPGFAAADVLLQQQEDGVIVPLSAAKAAARTAAPRGTTATADAASSAAAAAAGEAGEGWYVVGIRTADSGLGPNGEKKETFSPGVDLVSKYTFIAEGVRGSLAEDLIDFYNLRRQALCPPQYGLGLKEVWRLPSGRSRPGRVFHSMGWPLGFDAYGGGFLYEAHENLAFVGLIVGLDYKNPYLNPYKEFQMWKSHPSIQQLLKGGTCISFGAKCVNEGGIQAVPKLTFPGGMLLGCSGGLLNLAKVKGAHLAMLSGILAAEETAKALKQERTSSPEIQNQRKAANRIVEGYEERLKQSWGWQELKEARNVKPGFRLGLMGGLAGSFFHLAFTKGREPYTFKWEKRDSDTTEIAQRHKEIHYPKPDGVISFELLENLMRSGVHHRHDQPSHLKVRKGEEKTPVSVSFMKFAAPESRFCPAGVYEYLKDEKGDFRLQINHQNCIHCKTCAIKTPKEFIRWEVPEGGGGPNYSNM